nr:hypothetical protein [Hoylesella enoeca]
MEITEQEFEQMRSKIAEQQREIEQLKGKDIDDQIREHLQQRKRQEKSIAERCEQVRQSFK